MPTAHHPSLCTLAYWHQAYFTSTGERGVLADIQPVVQARYDANVDVVMQGHNHNYERLAPATPQRVADPARGIRAFVVGTGGIGHYTFEDSAANSEARTDFSFGVLRMTLRSGRYDWQFVNTGGTPFTDAGTNTCHERAASALSSGIRERDGAARSATSKAASYVTPPGASSLP